MNEVKSRLMPDEVQRSSAPKIGVIGGDGIGPEVVAEALKIVEALGVKYERVDYSLGAHAYLKTGDVLDDSVLDELRQLDAIVLGAVGPPVGSTEVPPGLLERGLLLKMRFELDLYVNLRPFNSVPNAPVQGIDFAVVRENTEGTYAGEGGFLRKGTKHEVATQGSVNTRHGVERCIRFAFNLANSRKAKHLTLVHKTNVLTFAGDLWQRTFDELASEFPEVTRVYNHVDATCIYMVEDPKRYDVIVTDNLFGDIITDLAGSLSGGIGLAASANLNPDRTGPSLFEPVHGAAHDIVGTGKANPLAAIRSIGMMLDYLGFTAEANKVSAEVIRFANEIMEKNTKGSSGMTTQQIGDAIAERII